jgi:hypothetical protein
MPAPITFSLRPTPGFPLLTPQRRPIPTKHRYWRVRSDSTYSTGFLGLATVAMRSVAGGTDLALGSSDNTLASQNYDATYTERRGPIPILALFRTRYPAQAHSPFPPRQPQQD